MHGVRLGLHQWGQGQGAQVLVEGASGAGPYGEVELDVCNSSIVTRPVGKPGAGGILERV